MDAFNHPQDVRQANQAETIRLDRDEYVRAGYQRIHRDYPGRRGIIDDDVRVLIFYRFEEISQLKCRVFAGLQSRFQSLHTGFISAEDANLFCAFSRKQRIINQGIGGPIAIRQRGREVIFSGDYRHKLVIQAAAHSADGRA